MWRTIEADGCTWEVRVISSESEQEDQETLEFRPAGQGAATRPPRRFIIARGAADKMNNDQLLAAHVQARPIGGDFYGRPGKRMPDAS